MTTGEDPVRDDDAEQQPAQDPPAHAPRPAPGPAPIIDLDGDAVPVQPVKPLGPRRLARLQRELAERSRELAETGAGPADPDLLEKQRRFAELAAHAAAANPVAEGTADPAAAGGVEAATPPDTAPAGQPGAEAERITVVFPDAPGGPDGPDPHDPVHVDPALFAHRLAPEELAALTHIEVLPAEDTEGSGSHAVPPGAPGVADTAADATAETPDTAASAGTAETAAEPVAAPDPDEEEPVPPAAPVPAATAEGLELLDPREYRRRPVNRWLAVLLLAVVAALVVVLVLFVL